MIILSSVDRCSPYLSIVLVLKHGDLYIYIIVETIKPSKSQGVSLDQFQKLTELYYTDVPSGSFATRRVSTIAAVDRQLVRPLQIGSYSPEEFS